METKLPEFMKPYFWDVKFEELDRERDWFFIVERLLDLGEKKHVDWVNSIYGKDKLEEVLFTSKTMNPMSANFYALFWAIDRDLVPSIKNPSHRKNDPYDFSWLQGPKTTLQLAKEGKWWPKDTGMGL